MKNLALFLVLASFSIAAFGQKVDFSGEWTLNREISELGSQFSLAPESLRVEHARRTLDMTGTTEFNGLEYQISQHLTLDGKTCENKGFNDSVTSSTAAYDKKSGIITIVTRGAMQGSRYTLTRTLSLKEGQLVVTSEAVSDMGTMNETFVFDKFL
jgi:hypothetical protein